jgi:hypothetical protein
VSACPCGVTLLQAVVAALAGVRGPGRPEAGLAEEVVKPHLGRCMLQFSQECGHGCLYLVNRYRVLFDGGHARPVWVLSLSYQACSGASDEKRPCGCIECRGRSLYASERGLVIDATACIRVQFPLDAVERLRWFSISIGVEPCRMWQTGMYRARAVLLSKLIMYQGFHKLFKNLDWAVV